MRFEKMSAGYAGLRRVLEERGTGPQTRLSGPETGALAEHLDTAARLHDFAAVVRVYERLEAAGALHPAPEPGSAEQDIYIHYVAAKLRLVPFETGYPLLREALLRYPAHPELARLQLLYLWSVAPDQVAEQCRAAGAPLDVPFDQLAVRGEALIRLDRGEKALQMALMARADRAARMDLCFLAANARRDPQRKLSWLNAYFALAGLGPVALKTPGQRFGIDNLTAEGAPPPAPEGAPLVSVIMTAYNAADHVETAAESILAQSHRNLELIICDDCSSDATPARIAALAERDARVIPLYRSENGGTYVAKTEALRQARGAFTVFHDSDDWAHPDKLRYELAAFEEEPDLVGVQTGWVRLDAEGQVQLRETGRYGDTNPAGTMLRTDPVRDRLGGFDPVRVGADSAFRQRVQRIFGMERWRTDPTVLVLGRQHAASLTQGGGGAPLDRFGWSVPRALYRGAWLDAMIGDREDPVWAPLGLRPRPVSVDYDYDALFTYDRFRRLGERGHAEDFVLAIRGRLEEAHLVQLHRMVLGARAAGYRFGVYFEDPSWIEGAWQAAHLCDMPDQHHYRDLSEIRAPFCIVVRSEPAGLMLRTLRSRQVTAAPDGTVRVAGKPGPPQIEKVHMLAPALDEHVAQLAAVPPEAALLVTHASLKRLWPIPRTPFEIAEFRTGAIPPKTMVLTGKFWAPDALAEIKALALRLGRSLVWLPANLAEIERRAGVAPPEDSAARPPYGPGIRPALGRPVLAAKIAEMAAGDGARQVSLPDISVQSAATVFDRLLVRVETRLGKGNEADAILRLVPSEPAAPAKSAAPGGEGEAASAGGPMPPQPRD